MHCVKLLICAAITCPALFAPANGQVTFVTDTTAPYDFATVATYTCNTGYGLIGGDVSRSCGGDMSNTTGVWSGVVPTCEGKTKWFQLFTEYLLFSAAITCTSLSAIQDGSILYEPDSTELFSFGSTATYSCREGFFIPRNVNPIRTCLANGTSTVGSWDGAAPQCTGRRSIVVTVKSTFTFYKIIIIIILYVCIFDFCSNYIHNYNEAKVFCSPKQRIAGLFFIHIFVMFFYSYYMFCFDSSYWRNHHLRYGYNSSLRLPDHGLVQLWRWFRTV